MDDSATEDEGDIYKTFSQGQREEVLKSKSKSTTKSKKRTNTSSGSNSKRSKSSSTTTTTTTTTNLPKRTGLISLDDSDIDNDIFNSTDEEANLLDRSKKSNLNKSTTSNSNNSNKNRTTSINNNSSTSVSGGGSKFSSDLIFDDEIETNDIGGDDDESIFNKNRDKLNNERREKSIKENNINQENKKNTNLDSSGIDRVKQSIHFTVAKMSEEKSQEFNVSVSKDLVSALSELVFSVTKDIIAKDIVAFARHAGRNIVEPGDVKLLARRNDGIKSILEMKEGERIDFND